MSGVEKSILQINSFKLQNFQKQKIFLVDAEIFFLFTAGYRKFFVKQSIKYQVEDNSQSIFSRNKYRASTAYIEKIYLTKLIMN